MRRVIGVLTILFLNGCASFQATQLSLTSDQSIVDKLLLTEVDKVNFALEFANSHNDSEGVVCLTEILNAVKTVQDSRSGPQSLLLAHELTRVLKRNSHPEDCVSYFLAL